MSTHLLGSVRHAEFLASAENGEITLLNVLPNSSRSLLRGFTADIRKFEAYMQEESEKKMREVARLFDIPMSRIHTRVVFGNVRDEILAISNNEAFDVIVIGSRKPGISTHLLGSNAESILRYAKTPVLVVR
ncbi:universal stress protein [Klebsiella quasipneumoniae]|uniref:universal stress protein n=1 Tax=Klebsiella quasipneumoniae TaxID=1463165 RepID=UPI0023E2133D|nr:universal stress protein [Klebsiella quasipneumoniae]